MTHAYILWIATFAYAAHVLEEYTFDWKNWAINVLKLPATWDVFAVANGVVMIVGITCAEVGWSEPSFALMLPALMLINAPLFHIVPFIFSRGRFSPGLLTAVTLFFPVGIWAYWGAWIDGVLTWTNALLSVLFGAAIMAYPIVMLKMQKHPYFKQD